MWCLLWWRRRLCLTRQFPPARTARCRPSLRFFARAFVDIATTLFWSKPLADFEKQLAEIEAARNEGLIRPILILPTLLNNREKTDIYLSGEASAIKDRWA